MASFEENAPATSAVLEEHGEEMQDLFSVLSRRGLRIRKSAPLRNLLQPLRRHQLDLTVNFSRLNQTLLQIQNDINYMGEALGLLP